MIPNPMDDSEHLQRQELLKKAEQQEALKNERISNEIAQQKQMEITKLLGLMSYLWSATVKVAQAILGQAYSLGKTLYSYNLKTLNLVAPNYGATRGLVLSIGQTLLLIPKSSKNLVFDPKESFFKHPVTLPSALQKRAEEQILAQSLIKDDSPNTNNIQIAPKLALVEPEPTTAALNEPSENPKTFYKKLKPR